MTSVIRLFLPAAATAATVLLAVGCSSSGSTAPAATPASHTTSAAPSHAATTAPATAVASASPSGSPSAATPTGADVYFAESQDITGTTAHAPGCQAGCPLSGDGTAVLWNMTWPTWTGGEAVGTGTEKIDDCDPNCAAAQAYSVKVIVTFSQPVKDCAMGEWFWSYATFTWPNGLPSALTADGGPVNPWDFTQLKSEATQSCA
jgi:hypothetical protein